ncbi:NAD(P)-dependent oxidoreductase [Sedimentibacter sp. zth1]|uniref:NAD-dependent epimerase/dehydratase family protein n=1 Tax=Sedimentibacter sp. zth1 TaxID=2816908 RepID=UPI001A91FBA0|nr:NAD(P)-dependent oxidoreductase [Sedimentibacter sp. zth1]QSX07148.1 NAD(P)-dependent oxidoreductase [Sedimentibacter sp. zth1]
MKNILLIGGSGFIGANIYKMLKNKYNFHIPISKQLDICKLDDLITYIKLNEIDIVINTAVYNKRDINPDIELYKNIKMTANIENISNLVEKVLYFGSGAEYDKRFPIKDVSEELFGQKIPDNAYGLSKYNANLIARNSKNIYNLRLFGVFGPYENWRSCFISNICCKAIFELPLSIRQDCEFDYMFIDDLVNIVDLFISSTPKHHDYNVVSGNTIRLTDIVEKIMKISGKELPINILKNGHNLPYTASNIRLKNEFDVKISLIDDSIAKLYNWYDLNRKIIDYDILKNTK